MSRKTEKDQIFNLRVPLAIFDRLREYKAKKPYLSLNSLIVMAIVQFLDTEERKEKSNEGTIKT